MPTNQQKKRRLQLKCDRLLQELVRSLYDTCLVCPKPLSCGHHYYPKSTCASLRYDTENLIPLCVGCHFHLHCGNPEIQNRINEIKGEEWLNGLKHKKKNTFVKTSLSYYKNIEDNLKKL